MEQSWSYDESKIEVYAWKERGGLRNDGKLFKIRAVIHVLFRNHLPLGLSLGYVNLRVFLLKYTMNFKYQNNY